MNKKQIIYSLKVMRQLLERGFVPEQTIPNPIKPPFNCWVFEVTEELQTALDEVLGGGSRNG